MFVLQLCVLFRGELGLVWFSVKSKLHAEPRASVQGFSKQTPNHHPKKPAPSVNGNERFDVVWFWFWFSH